MRIVAVAAFGAAAALALLGFLPPLRTDLGPTGVEVSARIARNGGTEVDVPPLGRVSAPTHDAPVLLEVAVDTVDLLDATGLIDRPEPLAALRREVTGDLERAGREFAARAMLLAGGVAAVAGLLLPRRRWHHALASGAGGAAAVGLLLSAAWQGFDADAFARSTYSGALTRAPQFFAAVEREAADFGDFQNRVSALTRRIAELDSLAHPAPRSPDETLILHVSDVHSNPIGLELVQGLAAAFDVDAVLDTGDLTSFGSPLEPHLLRIIEDLPVPYLFVPGNHDSPENRRLLDQIPGLVLLDGESVHIGGVEIAGAADPSYTAEGATEPAEADALRKKSSPAVAALARALRPDVLAVHHHLLAGEALGEVPVVVAGHIHRRTMRVEQQTIVLTVGSTGASGLGSLLGDPTPHEAELLRFVDGRLTGVEYVTVDKLSGGFRVEHLDVPGTAQHDEHDRGHAVVEQGSPVEPTDRGAAR